MSRGGKGKGVQEHERNGEERPEVLYEGVNQGVRRRKEKGKSGKTEEKGNKKGRTR